MEWCNVLFWEMEFAMKMSMLSVLVLGLCISFCGFADAQSVTEKSTQKSPVQSKIALCDVEHLLNNYAPFQKTLRETDEEWAAAQASLKANREKIEKLEITLFEYQTSSREYMHLEELIEMQKSEARVEMKLFRRQLDRVRSDARSNAIKSIQELVKSFSLRHGIELVMHQPTQGKPAAEMETPFSGVVFHRDLDITLKMMEVLQKNELAVGSFKKGLLRLEIPAGLKASDERIFSFFIGMGR
jgi:Skp family chaperone for outer membrane proteins